MYNITDVCTFISRCEGLYAVNQIIMLTELHRIKGAEPNSGKTGMSAFAAPPAVTGNSSSVE
jgi:hypothetical protein